MHRTRGAVVPSAYGRVAGRDVVVVTVIVAWRRVRLPARVWRRRTRRRCTNACRTVPRRGTWPATEKTACGAEDTRRSCVRPRPRPSWQSPPARLLRRASPRALCAATTPSAVRGTERGERAATSGCTYLGSTAPNEPPLPVPPTSSATPGCVAVCSTCIYISMFIGPPRPPAVPSLRPSCPARAVRGAGLFLRETREMSRHVPYRPLVARCSPSRARLHSASRLLDVWAAGWPRSAYFDLPR